jgi:hypothetical protein
MKDTQKIQCDIKTDRYLFHVYERGGYFLLSPATTELLKNNYFSYLLYSMSFSLSLIVIPSNRFLPLSIAMTGTGLRKLRWI